MSDIFKRKNICIFMGSRLCYEGQEADVIFNEVVELKKKS